MEIDVSGVRMHAEAEWIRGRGPAVPVVLPGGVRGWAVNRQADIRRLLVDPRVSKDAYRHWPAWAGGEVDDRWPLAIWVSVQNMHTAYGEEHTRLRRPLAAAFTSRRVSDLRPRVEAVVGELLDGLARVGGEGRTVDLRAALAHELPTRIVFELFGIPERSWAPLHKIIKGFFDTAISAEDARRNTADLNATMADLVAYRRGSPGPDLTSALITARDGARGEAPFSEKELLDNLILLFTAGYETSANLISTALYELLRAPDQLALVRAGAASWQDAVEESLRVEAPAAYGLLRFAVEDIDMGEGVVIAQGDPILVSFASAGRDPAVHGPDAARFDVTRSTRAQHLSFGHGTHHCPGATLARLECVVALRRFFTRFPEAALAPGVRGEGRGPARVESFISNGLRELPVVLGRQAAPHPDPGPGYGPGLGYGYGSGVEGGSGSGFGSGGGVEGDVGFGVGAGVRAGVGAAAGAGVGVAGGAGGSVVRVEVRGAGVVVGPVGERVPGVVHVGAPVPVSVQAPDAGSGAGPGAASGSGAGPVSGPGVVGVDAGTGVGVEAVVGAGDGVDAGGGAGVDAGGVVGGVVVVDGGSVRGSGGGRCPVRGV
ncbi:cytochrome P450 [Streptomyces subrutilus]|uniref:cytochrome P450 family protein n=1 Tax=Streptomyces subrutilus TaxID=36818 RepID=UPI003437C012